jgi:CheY-like chemotaxis protein
MGRTATDETGGLLTMPKILLVDDTDSVRACLSRILKHNGFEVVEAANVNDALKLIGLLSVQAGV